MTVEDLKRIYNKKARDKFSYEHNRWFQTSAKKAGYDMTLKSIKCHLLKKDISIKNYLELGPGTGTWTKFFIEKYKKANFDLIDISDEMLKLAKKNLNRYREVTINYIEKDFLQFEPEKKYDLFFSCRVLEYLPDKEVAIKKIADSLKPGGWGLVITKTPKYLRNKILGRKIPELHQGQISPRKLKKLLKKSGFKEIKIYPVTTNFPLLHSLKINKSLHKIFYKHKLNFISKFFAESYCVKFAKP